MIGKGLAVCALLALAGPAAADTYWEVDRFDLTGVLPDAFDAAGTPSFNRDGWTYVSQDGLAELEVFGSHRMTDMQTYREVVRQGLLSRGATIVLKFSTPESFSYAGIDQERRAYFRFTQTGATCEGDPVFGSFVFSYPADLEDYYGPMIDILRDGFHIGACG